MREIYEFGLELGKSGIFDKNQIIMITRLFYNDIDKNKLLEVILKACDETKITMCDSLTNNLYDSETKFNFQMGLLNGTFYEGKEENPLNNVISLKEAAKILSIPTTTFRTAVQKGEYDDVGKKISSIWVFDKDLLFKKYICKKEIYKKKIDKFFEDYTENNKKIIYDFIEKHKIDENTNRVDINGRTFNFNWNKEEINVITLSIELINYKYLHKASNSYKNTNIFKNKDFYVENFRDLRFLLDTYEIELYIDSSCSENNFKTLTTFLLPTSEILSDEFLNKFEEVLSKYEDKFSREIEYLSERF
ncbi:hypothetical protein [Clostridioides difficile]|uniref:hypothetical protein n=1 Tax=Clostridioides difficile TaxID=1496 RepID=UPI001033D683|nr:hypothetical protein [Clostridioides difficile]MDM9944060.1 hypothetical protein [Clostridioides difficile]